MRTHTSRRLLQMTTCLIIFACAHFSSFAQQNVTGKVLSSKDQVPLPGVTVNVVGTSTTVTTKNDGAFTITVKDGASLNFSMVGYLPKQIKVTGRNVGNIALEEDVKFLSSVVVVGYGTQKKVNLTGSIATIDMTEKEGQPITNVSNALHGAPGLFVNLDNSQPGLDRSTIRIRGMGTLNDNDPLVLVDGIEYSMDELNPADIASISVLKDASAAIYGSKAANGVILVTTKTGKGTPKVNYSYYYGRQKPTTMPDAIWDPIVYMNSRTRHWKILVKCMIILMQKLPSTHRG